MKLQGRTSVRPCERIIGGMMRMAVLCVFAALVLGCSGPADTEERPHGDPPPQGEGTALLPASTPEPTAAPAPTRVPAAAEEERPDLLPNGEGTSAYDFAFSLFQGEEVLGGQELRLSEVSGKPIVLNFWARYCTPCWTEMPELQDFYESTERRCCCWG